MKKLLAILMAVCLVIPVFAAAEDSDYYIDGDGNTNIMKTCEYFFRFLNLEKEENMDTGSDMVLDLLGPDGYSPVFYYFSPSDVPSARIYFVVLGDCYPWGPEWKYKYTPYTMSSINSDGNKYYRNFREVRIKDKAVLCVDYYPRGVDEAYYMTNFYFPEQLDPENHSKRISILHFYIDEAGEYQEYDGEELDARAEEFLGLMDMTPERLLSIYTAQTGDWEALREKAEAAGGHFENIKNTSLKIWIPDAMEMISEASDSYNSVSWDSWIYQYTSEQTADWIEGEDKRIKGKMEVRASHGQSCEEYKAYIQAENALWRELEINGIEASVHSYIGPDDPYMESRPLEYIEYLFPLEDGHLSLYFTRYMYNEYGGGIENGGGLQMIPIDDPLYWYYTEWMAASVQPAD